MQRHLPLPAVVAHVCSALATLLGLSFYTDGSGEVQVRSCSCTVLLSDQQPLPLDPSDVFERGVTSGRSPLANGSETLKASAPHNCLSPSLTPAVTPLWWWFRSACLEELFCCSLHLLAATVAEGVEQIECML